MTTSSRFREFVFNSTKHLQLSWKDLSAFLEKKAGEWGASLAEGEAEVVLGFKDGTRVVVRSRFLGLRTDIDYEIRGLRIKFIPQPRIGIRGKNQGLVERALIELWSPFEAKLPERVISLPIPGWVEISNPYGNWSEDFLASEEMFLSEAKEAWEAFASQDPFVKKHLA